MASYLFNYVNFLITCSSKNNIKSYLFLLRLLQLELLLLLQPGAAAVTPHFSSKSFESSAASYNCKR
jgi:hypothetical protein